MGERQTRIDKLVYLAKVQILRARRLIIDLRKPVHHWPQKSASWQCDRVEVRCPLYADDRPEERAYQLGKVANLRAALRSLDGVEVPAGEIFSFWRQAGRATTQRGFVRGRMLQLGCVVPAIGGGLCQLSNALYELALRTGCEIIERHPHSARLLDSPLRDATVAWNYIDLRFRPKYRLRLDLKLTSTELVAAFLLQNSVHSAKSLPLLRSSASVQADQLSTAVTSITCATCQEVDCSRHEILSASVERTQAFLVDALWPEFDRYILETHRKGDWLCVPLDGTRWRQPQYGWSTEGFDHVKTVPTEVLRRSWRLRHLSSQGALRQTELLRASERIALSMVAKLPFSVSHLVIDQTMLPALWRSGALGGRTFDVLMRRLPIRILQDRLDNVSARWPQSPTAADFRAEEGLLKAEEDALDAASCLVTPHTELAVLFPGRTLLLDWIVPDATQFMRQADGAMARIFFPGPLTARKGAYVLREALQGLPVEVIWRGPELEGSTFWSGIHNRRGLSDSLGVAAVIQPAFLEDRPRALLHAVASGIPVITTSASGLLENDCVELVRMGDVDDLRQAISRLLRISKHTQTQEATGPLITETQAL